MLVVVVIIIISYITIFIFLNRQSFSLERKPRKV